jgi:general secretion pathway protein D
MYRSRINVRHLWHSLLATLLLGTATAHGQNTAATFQPNFREVDLVEVIEAVAQQTGKTFILDPRVRAKVSLVSTRPMTTKEFYDAFLSLLQVHGFAAVPAGAVIKIVPDSNVRQMPGNDLPPTNPPSVDEVVTRVIKIERRKAADLVPVLRPLLPPSAQISALPAANVLVISDRASNMARIEKLVRRLDRGE